MMREKVDDVVPTERVRNWRMYLSWYAFLVAEHFLSALILTFAIAGSLVDFGRIWLVMSLNIFAIPILLFGWNFVWWVNFGIILTWIGYYSTRKTVKHLWQDV
jgi:hypothetical protein